MEEEEDDGTCGILQAQIGILPGCAENIDFKCDESSKKRLTRQRENSSCASWVAENLDVLDITDETDEKQSSASDESSEAWSVGIPKNWKYEEDYDDYLPTVTNTMTFNDEKEDWDAELVQCAEQPYDQDELVDLQCEQQHAMVTIYQWSEDMVFIPSIHHARPTSRFRQYNTAEEGQFSDADQ